MLFHCNLVVRLALKNPFEQLCDESACDLGVIKRPAFTAGQVINLEDDVSEHYEAYVEGHISLIV